ncbi:putative gustatory receptor 58a [Anastrepha ludens]|uniref:putative gustatory receptor 58a n=1 Tax=Anastrepha ludens TaxID=28586 RepID=UPI0023B1FCCD|nr:putative gustatory receptor 58a [Anastrepha ludens]
MLRERLLRFVLNISYYNSLAVGLLPAPLDKKSYEFRSTRLYLAHSVFAHIFYLVASTCASLYYFHAGYMTIHLVLQWTYNITNVTKIFFIIVLIKEIWCKRRCVMEAFVDYFELEAQHEAFLCEHQYKETEENENEVYIKYLKRYTASLIICKFFLGYGLLLLNAYIFISQHPGSDPWYPPITFISYVLNTFALTVSGHFFYVFCQLYRQFAQINSQLHLLLEQLHQHQRPNDVVATVFARRINSLATLHLDGYRLAQRILTIGELTLAALLLRLFVVNMRTVYSACLFLSQNSPESLWPLANELLYTFAFFADTIMVMGILDATLDKCNDTGQVLRAYVEVEDTHNAECLRKALDSFAAHLSTHKLRYKVCGLFEFNKGSSLHFFMMVLVKVTVLVQFDMQNKLKA